jgi:predicted acyltransferase
MLSLDVFRGLTIAGMMLVNNAGDWGHVYAPLAHAPWNGLTPTDLIFPFFLFIVGVSMVLSQAKRLEAGSTRPVLLRHTLIRAGGILAIGLFLNGFPFFDLASIRIPGVLQRIAVAYLCGSMLSLFMGRRGLLWISTSILVAYWAAMRFIPVPGIGAGVFTPSENLAAYLDRLVLHGHMWGQTKTWDPEGILSTFPAVVTVLLGALTGDTLRSSRSLQEKINVLFVGGTVLAVLGWAIHPFFPVNKNLWTSSYVLVTGGLALVGLALCVYAIDVRRRDGWISPFVVFGRNALASYVAAGVLAAALNSISLSQAHGGSVNLQERIFQLGFGWIANRYVASVSYALCFVAVTWLFALFLYRRRWFIRL